MKLDQINNPELIVNVSPASAAVAFGKPISVPVDVGTGVSLPITTKPELDTTVTPLGTDVVSGTSVGCWPVTVAGINVKVSPRAVVSMVEVATEGMVTESAPVTTTVWPLLSMAVDPTVLFFWV